MSTCVTHVHITHYHMQGGVLSQSAVLSELSSVVLSHVSVRVPQTSCSQTALGTSPCAYQPDITGARSWNCTSHTYFAQSTHDAELRQLHSQHGSEIQTEQPPLGALLRHLRRRRSTLSVIRSPRRIPSTVEEAVSPKMPTSPEKSQTYSVWCAVFPELSMHNV